MFKELLRRNLFRDELTRLEALQAAAKARQDRYEMLTSEHERYAKGLGVTDLVREQLGGFNRRLLDEDDDLPTLVGDEHEQNTFLAHVKELATNEALPIILDALIRDQVLFIAKEAQGTEQANFGRASINGWTLLREEVARLYAIYLDRHTKEEVYDEHEVV